MFNLSQVVCINIKHTTVQAGRRLDSAPNPNVVDAQIMTADYD